MKQIIHTALAKKVLYIFLFMNLVICALCFPFKIQAQTSMSNGSYTIRFPNLNSFAGKSSNPQYKLGITGGQTSPGLYTGSNYKARVGFQYINSITPFSFAISSLFIDFGPITPGAPVTRTNNLTVSNGSAYGYTVLTQQNHPMRVYALGTTIPDTTCDSGSCDNEISDVWNNLTTYGFGYRCDNIIGSDCQSGFAVANTYRQFPSRESNEVAFPVMRGVNEGRDIESQITYKVNVSNTQVPGMYENAITYIAVPSI